MRDIPNMLAKMTAGSFWPMDIKESKSQSRLRIKQRTALGSESESPTTCDIETPLDIAAVLSWAKIKGEAEWYVLAAYCDDQPSSYKLVNLLSDKAAKFQDRTQVFFDKAQCDGAALAAIWPFLFTPKCDNCKGSGATIQGHCCSRCGGDGKAKLSERTLAQLADIPRTTWQRHWKACHSHLHKTLLEIEQAALLKLQEYLSKKIA